ncbi:MAG: tRNA lysidine(34) synthetase TilS [Acidihalobacter sp.]
MAGRSFSFAVEALAFELGRLPCSGRWVVGFSGGADSYALLHALAALDGLGRDVVAVHVHHALQPQAEEWVSQCAGMAQALGAQFQVLRVDVRETSEQGVEAAAREARYAALEQCMRSGDVLLTAHHRDDQAETLLLQLLRGAGPAGLAGMPQLTPFGIGWHARPLLGQTRESLQEYLRLRGLEWIEDPSNRSLDAARNYLRHRIMPVLQARWPAAGRTLARAAQHQAETLELTTALGRTDIEAASAGEPGTLSVAALRTLTRARLHNALRVWLADKNLPVPNAARLEQVRGRVLHASVDAQPHLRWPGGELRRYRDALYAMPPLPPHDPAQVIAWDRFDEPLDIPALGRELSVAELRSDLDALRCAGEPVNIRFRRGGERCRVRGKAHSRALKTLLQEAGVPPWERDRIPLLYVGERLQEVIGYWLCAERDS